MTYKESKNVLEDIRNRNEMLFRMAISHLMDVGIRHLTDDIVEENCKEIMGQDDTHSFMTNEFQCAIIRTAGELAKVDHIHLLVYIQEEIEYAVGQPENPKGTVWLLRTNWAFDASCGDAAFVYDSKEKAINAMNKMIEEDTRPECWVESEDNCETYYAVYEECNWCENHDEYVIEEHELQ